MKSSLKVYIADDHTLYRKAMVNLLLTFKNITIVKDAENGKELINLIKVDEPDLCIIDLQMPVMGGAETCEYLVSKYPNIKIVVLTMHDSEKFILHMIESGAHAFLLKNTEPAELEKAITSVIENDFYHNDLVASILRKNVKTRRGTQIPSFKPPVLSDREKEILTLLCQELTIREIGDRLSLSENTIRNHRVNIMDKIGATNTVGLVKFAYESGILL
jgi:DNA-binding NarL/FixJ family response regulator